MAKKIVTRKTAPATIAPTEVTPPVSRMLDTSRPTEVPSTGTTVESLSVEELRAILERRVTEKVESLKAQREASFKAILEIDESLKSLGIPTGPVTAAPSRGAGKTQAPRAQAATVAKKGAKRGGARGKNSQPLGQVVHTALASMPKRQGSVKDLQEAVLNSDYKTKSNNVYQMVYAVLQDQDMFRKVDRGTYEAL